MGDIVAGPGPEPGWLIVFLGLGMVAGEFKPAARFMGALYGLARGEAEKTGLVVSPKYLVGSAYRGANPNHLDDLALFRRAGLR